MNEQTQGLIERALQQLGVVVGGRVPIGMCLFVIIDHPPPPPPILSFHFLIKAPKQ